jgi:hypothetical protein
VVSRPFGARPLGRGHAGNRAAREAPTGSRCRRYHLPRHRTRHAVRAAEDKSRKPHYCNSCCQLRKPAGLFLSTLAFLPLSRPQPSTVQSHPCLSYISHPNMDTHPDLDSRLSNLIHASLISHPNLDTVMPACREQGTRKARGICRSIARPHPRDARVRSSYPYDRLFPPRRFDWERAAAVLAQPSGSAPL